ncbi:MAG: hypothetical protein IKA41_06305 [Bacteroidaceae bacterium]|nr:hypothetical protein [Bacteroidaceae bacterium]
MSIEIEDFGAELLSGDGIRAAYDELYCTESFGSEILAIPEGQHVPVYTAFGCSTLEALTIPSVEYTKYAGKYNVAMPLMSYGNTPQTNHIKYITGIAISLPWETRYFGWMSAGWKNHRTIALQQSGFKKKLIAEGIDDETAKRWATPTLRGHFDMKGLAFPSYVIENNYELWFLYSLKEAVPMYDSIADHLQDAVNIFASKLCGLLGGKEAEEYTLDAYTPLNRPIPVAGSLYKGQPVEMYVCHNADPVTVNTFLAHLPADRRFEYKKSKLSLAEAEVRLPKWYKRRIENQTPAGERNGDPRCGTGEAFFHWFYRQCLECENLKFGAPKALLAVAIKTQYKAGRDIVLGALYSVYRKLYPKLPRRWCREKALELLEQAKDYREEKKLRCLKRETLVDWSGVEMKANKRNERTRKAHLELLAKTKKEKFKTDPDYSNSRCGVVVRWRKDNPTGNKSQCARELKIDRKTVAKYWDAKIVNHRDGSTTIKYIKRKAMTEKQKAKKRETIIRKKREARVIAGRVMKKRRVAPVKADIRFVKVFVMDQVVLDIRGKSLMEKVMARRHRKQSRAKRPEKRRSFRLRT